MTLPCMIFVSSVTKWLGFVFNFGPLQQLNFAKYLTYFGQKLRPKQNKRCQIILKFRRSGESLQNLVSLFLIGPFRHDDASNNIFI